MQNHHSCDACSSCRGCASSAYVEVASSPISPAMKPVPSSFKHPVLHQISSDMKQSECFCGSCQALRSVSASTLPSSTSSMHRITARDDQPACDAAHDPLTLIPYHKVQHFQPSHSMRQSNFNASVACSKHSPAGVPSMQLGAAHSSSTEHSHHCLKFTTPCCNRLPLSEYHGFDCAACMEHMHSTVHCMHSHGNRCGSCKGGFHSLVLAPEPLQIEVPSAPACVHPHAQMHRHDYDTRRHFPPRLIVNPICCCGVDEYDKPEPLRMEVPPSPACVHPHDHDSHHHLPCRSVNPIHCCGVDEYDKPPLPLKKPAIEGQPLAFCGSLARPTTSLVTQTRELHSLWWTGADCQRALMEEEVVKRPPTQGGDCCQAVSHAKEENIVKENDQDLWKESSFADMETKMTENSESWERATFEKQPNKSNENCWKGGFRKDTQAGRQNCWKGAAPSFGKQTNAKDEAFSQGAMFRRQTKTYRDGGFWKGASSREREKNMHNAKPWGWQHNNKRKRENFAGNRSNSFSTWDEPSSSNKTSTQEVPISPKDCNDWGDPIELNKSAGWLEETCSELKETPGEAHIGLKNSPWEEPIGSAKFPDCRPAGLNNNTLEEPFGLKNKEEFLTTMLPSSFVGQVARSWEEPCMRAQKVLKEPASAKAMDKSQVIWSNPPANGKTIDNAKGPWIDRPPENENRSEPTPNENTSIDVRGTCTQVPEHMSGWEDAPTEYPVLTQEEQKEATFMADAQEVTLEREFLSSSSDDTESGDDLVYESEGDTQHPPGDGSAKAREDQAYEFFMQIFEENQELQKMYKEECTVGQFECLVCSNIPNKSLKRYNGLLSVVMHAKKILNTKRRREHRGYARAVCYIMHWDANGNPIAPTGNVKPRACLLGPDSIEEELKNSDDLGNESVHTGDTLFLESKECPDEGEMKDITVLEANSIMVNAFGIKDAYKAFREQVLDKTFGPGKLSFNKDTHSKDEVKEAGGVFDETAREGEDSIGDLQLGDEKVDGEEANEEKNQAAVVIPSLSAADAQCKDGCAEAIKLTTVVLPSLSEADAHYEDGGNEDGGAETVKSITVVLPSLSEADAQCKDGGAEDVTLTTA